MNVTIKFESGKTYNDRSAYGDAFSSWKCVGRTASTVTFKNSYNSGVNKFRLTVIGGEGSSADITSTRKMSPPNRGGNQTKGQIK